MRYKFIKDLTSDVFFEAYGKTQKAVFQNAALAMFSVICDLKRIKKLNKVKIEVNAKDEKELLFSWLQALIAESEIEEIFFSSFKINKISPTHIQAIAIVEPISQEKGNTLVKAVTNYKFDLKRSKEGYVASISLDI
jgi:SHS2 domain-containing protein